MNLAKLLGDSFDTSMLEFLRLMADEASVLGFPAYLVGGSVRDLMLTRSIMDIDLALEGDAVKLGRALVKKHGGTLTIHEKFHTAIWHFDSSPASPRSLDLISTRHETYSHPGALPTVQKSTINDDLRRRDFTINAMAIRLDGDDFGELLDPLGGQSDLENKLVRTLHPGSFLDDPTRMFRAARYAVRYQFAIEQETRKLVNDDARSVLSKLSGERLRHEFDLIFEEENPSAILQQLAVLNLTRSVHPMLAKTDIQLPSMELPPSVFGEFAIPNILSFRQSLGWTLYLAELSVVEVESIAARLDFPALLTKTILSASVLKGDLPSLTKWKPSQWTFHLDELPSLSVYAVYLMSKENALYDYLAKWQHVKPVTTGDDLKQRGLEPGPRYGEILRRLRAAWLDGEVQDNDAEKTLLDELLK